MFGFTKVSWTEEQFRTFCEKRELYFSPTTPSKGEWLRQGCHPFVHAKVVYDYTACALDYWINDEILAKEVA